jgi:hypothetical protein
MAVPSKKDRDARLDELSAAVKAWAKQRRRDLNNQVGFAKRLLRGRGAGDRLNNTTVQQASDLLVDELDQFLTGE